MKPEAQKAARGLWQTPPKQNVWEWARDSVDFSREPRYDTEYKAPYDPEYMPFFKEPAECVNDRDVKECWVLKCSRAGASEKPSPPSPVPVLGGIVSMNHPCGVSHVYILLFCSLGF